MYFETRVKVTSEGKRKAFNYLVDAMSFTEAEARTLKAVEGMADVEVEAVKRSKVAYWTANSDGGEWYRITYQFTPETKPVTEMAMIQADSDAAASGLIDSSLPDFKVTSVSLTKIVEVLR